MYETVLFTAGVFVGVLCAYGVEWFKIAREIAKDDQ